MSGMGSERIEPTPRVIEPQETEPRGRPDSGARRRRPPTPEESEIAENPEAPVHQVDRLA
jgi:hypothetical protein